MLEELATVVAVGKDTVTLTSKIKSTCSSCQQVDTCGSGQVAKALPHKQLTVDVVKTCDVKIGDTVVLGIPEDALLTSAWQVYLLPLVFFIGSAGIAQWLTAYFAFEHELLVILTAGVGGYSGYRLAKYLQQACIFANNLQPKLLRNLNSR